MLLAQTNYLILPISSIDFFNMNFKNYFQFSPVVGSITVIEGYGFF